MNIDGKINNKTINYRIVFKNDFMYTFSFSNKEIVKAPHIIPNNVVVNNNGLPKQGQEVIQNHMCTIYRYKNNKVWFWNNYLIKIVNATNNSTFEINSVDDNINVPNNIFNLPTNYKIKELNFNFGN